MIYFAGPVGQAFENNPAVQLLSAIISVGLLALSVFIVFKVMKATQRNFSKSSNGRKVINNKSKAAPTIIVASSFVISLYSNVFYTQHSQGTWNYVFIWTCALSLLGIYLLSIYEKYKK